MKPKRRVPVRPVVRVRLSVLLNEALDRAIAFASRRAFKHRSEPIATPEDLATALVETLPPEVWRVLEELGVEIE